MKKSNNGTRFCLQTSVMMREKTRQVNRRQPCSLLVTLQPSFFTCLFLLLVPRLSCECLVFLLSNDQQEKNFGSTVPAARCGKMKAGRVLHSGHFEAPGLGGSGDQRNRRGATGVGGQSGRGMGTGEALREGSGVKHQATARKLVDQALGWSSCQHEGEKKTRDIFFFLCLGANCMMNNKMGGSHQTSALSRTAIGAKATCKTANGSDGQTPSIILFDN